MARFVLRFGPYAGVFQVGPQLHDEALNDPWVAHSSVTYDEHTDEYALEVVTVEGRDRPQGTNLYTHLSPYRVDEIPQETQGSWPCYPNPTEAMAALFRRHEDVLRRAFHVESLPSAGPSFRLDQVFLYDGPPPCPEPPELPEPKTWYERLDDED